jgi:flagellar biosynthetic protein FliP
MTEPMPNTHTGTHSGTRPQARRWRRFALHYVEMIIAMFVGMFALELLWSAIGIDFSYARDPELAYLLMAFDMSVGMAAWMRFRGHAWARTLEMCGAMFAPVVPLFPLLWLGVIDGMTVMIVAHVAMFPLMLAAMLWRRDEYAHAHH